MGLYLARRFAYLIVVLFAVTFAVSAMVEIVPGDPAAVLIGENATPEQIAVLRKELRLDEPLHERYISWVSSAVRGDLGTSPRTQVDVWEQITTRLPVSIQLLLVAQFVALLYAVMAAVYGANRPGRLVDSGSTFWSFVMLSTPSFVVGLILLRVFAVQLGWFDVGGYTRITENLGENLRSIVLPVLAIAADPAAIYQRVLRTDVGRTLSEDFIMAAQAKGLPPRKVLFRHALRPSTFSLLTLVGINSARLIGGSVIVETIFGLPGIGKLLIDSINGRDFVTVQGVVAVIAIGYVVINSAVDLLYGVVDPRVRRERH